MLTDDQIKEYRKVYRRELVKAKKDRDIAHVNAWREFRARVIASHPVGWWTETVRSTVLKEIEDTERSIR